MNLKKHKPRRLASASGYSKPQMMLRITVVTILPGSSLYPKANQAGGHLRKGNQLGGAKHEQATSSRQKEAPAQVVRLKSAAAADIAQLVEPSSSV